MLKYPSHETVKTVKMKKALFLLMLLHLSAISFAQKENNIWTMGYHAGLDFNSGSAVPVTNSMVTIGSSASICDASGNLMFYTSGDSVWDKNGHAMPNGYDLIAPYTAIKGNALIVPVINNPNQYYVFTHEGVDNILAGDVGAGRFFYSKIDMTLNGGLGDVISTEKGIFLDSSLSDKVIAVAGNDCNMWVLTHRYDTSFFYTDTSANKFEAFEVTDTGIITKPVISTSGNLSGVVTYVTGDMVVSSDRKKIALVSTNGLPTGLGAEIYDFDPATGIVSNAVTLDTANSDVGISFSPDNSKLYITTSPESGLYNLLYQYDLSLGSASAIISSKTQIDTLSTMPSYATSLRLGPNGKIYGMCGDENFTIPVFGASGADSIFYVDSPNLAGSACHVILNALAFDSGTGSPYGFGSKYVKPIVKDTVYASSDSSMTDSIALHVPAGYFFYQWSSGASDTSIEVKDAGTYWVRYGNYCALYVDTFKVNNPSFVSTVNNKEAAIKIYPNPAQSFITTDIAGANNNGTVKIVDALGRIMIEKNYEHGHQQIDVNELANGVYTLIYIDKTDASFQCRFSIVR